MGEPRGARGAHRGAPYEGGGAAGRAEDDGEDDAGGGAGRVRFEPRLMLGAMLALSVGACTPRHPLPQGYTLHASAPFGPAARLEILEDARITDSVRAAVATWDTIFACKDVSPELPPSFCAS